MTSLIFPDLNVWIALTMRAHRHHQAGWNWYQTLDPEAELVFCRTTQVGFLRLLTTESVARAETLNQMQAWNAYDKWVYEGGAFLLPEPAGVESRFRQLTHQLAPACKEWTDSYLAAFAEMSSSTLVTFDRALHQRAQGSLLLA